MGTIEIDFDSVCEDPGYFHLKGAWVHAREARSASSDVLAYMYQDTETVLRDKSNVFDIPSYMKRQDDLAKASAEVLYSTYRDRGSGLTSAQLWRANDRANRRKSDGAYKSHAGKMPRLGAFLILTITYGVSLEEAAAALDRFLDRLEAKYGVASESVIHAKEGQPDHAHVFLTDRFVDAAGIGKKNRDLNGVAAKMEGRGIVDGDAYLAPAMETMRAIWAEEMRVVAPAGARTIDHRSFKRRGIDITPVKNFSHKEMRRQKRARNETWKLVRAEELAQRAARRRKMGGGVADTIIAEPQPVETLCPPTAPPDPPDAIAPAVVAAEHGVIDAAAVLAKLTLPARKAAAPNIAPLFVAYLAARSRGRIDEIKEVQRSIRAQADNAAIAGVAGRLPRHVHRALPLETKGASDLGSFHQLWSDAGKHRRSLSEQMQRHESHAPSSTPLAIASAFMIGVLRLWMRRARLAGKRVRREQALAMIVGLANHRTAGSTAVPNRALIALGLAGLRANATEPRQTSGDDPERQRARERQEVVADPVSGSPKIQQAPPCVASTHRFKELTGHTTSSGGPAFRIASEGDARIDRPMHRGSPPYPVTASVVEDPSKSATARQPILPHPATESATQRVGVLIEEGAAQGRLDIRQKSVILSAPKSGTCTVGRDERRADAVDASGYGKETGGASPDARALKPDEGWLTTTSKQRAVRSDQMGAPRTSAPAEMPEAEKATIGRRRKRSNEEKRAVLFAASLYQDRKWSQDFGKRLCEITGFEGDFEATMRATHRRVFRDPSLTAAEVRKVVRHELHEKGAPDLLLAFDEIEAFIRAKRLARKKRVHRAPAQSAAGRADDE